MTMKIHDISYGPGVPAHPVFRAALEALPNAWPSVGKNEPPELYAPRRGKKGVPWGVPEYVWISPHDRKALGLPAEIGPGHPMLGILVTKTKKLGELPHLMRVIYMQDMPAGKMAFGSSYAHRTRHQLNRLFFYRWRCGAHEDCLDNVALGQACAAARDKVGPVVFRPPRRAGPPGGSF